MNYALSFLSLIAVHLPGMATAKPARPAIDLARMASAIEAVENTPNWKVGPYGERSRFQITRDVWQRHSSMPFEYASSSRIVCRAEVTRVAFAHIDWLRDRLAVHNLAETPYNVALAWGAGVTAAVRGTASAAKRGYADRARNIYESGD